MVNLTPSEAKLPETYDELIEALDASSGEPVQCLAWAVGGGDPDNLEIQTARSKFTNARGSSSALEGESEFASRASSQPQRVLTKS